MVTTPAAAPTPPPPPPFGSPAPRQLRRRPDEGHIAGVCAGLADYFNVDPVIVRIATVVLAFSGPGIIAYILAWIFVPEADASSSGPFARPPSDRRDRGAQIFGIVLLALSVSILWGGWWSPARRWLLPIGLIVLGAWLLLRRDPDTEDGAAGAAPWTAPPPSDAPTGSQVRPWAAPVAAPSTDAPVDRIDAGEGEKAGPAGGAVPGHETRVGASLDGGVAGGGADTIGDATLVGAPFDGAAGGGDDRPPWEPGTWAAGPPPVPEVPESVRAARRRRRMVFPIVMGALLLWAGIGSLADVSLQSGLAIALCIVGIGFVLGAFVGGSKALIVPAFVVGAALIATSVIDIPLSGPIGHRTWTPRAVSQVEDRYELSAGEGVVDLTELRLGAEQRLEIVASIGVGHLVIEVPDGAALEVTAQASAGDALVLGRSTSGLGVSVQRSYAGDGESGTIELDVEVGLGQLEVRRGAAGPRTTAPTATTVLG